ncbi:hypothetical protein GN244_ATG14496 [Phytophthora infestans]|uniref:Uncharacterized protein n=1 Tax=Phytophthora infestans TaxID=4787 RepID=A0A833SW95_PHYIN|nr:hypothetical protein GN244_ATG14496 [Phytophthora infestans]
MKVAASYCYKYVISEDLVILLQAGFSYFRRRQAGERKTYSVDQDVVDLTCTPRSADDVTPAVWVTIELDPFSRQTCERSEKDLNWLVQDWSKVSGRPVECFATETGSNGKTEPAAKQKLV